MRLAVTVHPRAGRERLLWDGQVVQLWITSPPVDGAANAAVLSAVASWLGVSPGRVRLVVGRHGRHKVIDVDGMEAPPD
jgi:uncharacterized protein YggU (UPF0235/DUF167 family)